MPPQFIDEVFSPSCLSDLTNYYLFSFGLGSAADHRAHTSAFSQHAVAEGFGVALRSHVFTL